MIVKILSSTSSFSGVDYNTKKTQNSKGELMRVKNFGYLELSKEISPSEAKNFLIAHSSKNTVVKNKQLHIAISGKGKEYDKQQLTEIAEKWMEKMGYKDNPYLIVYHSDTSNNHVHIVSSRIGRDGKKINDSFEKIRAQNAIKEIIGQDPKRETSEVLNDLRKYSYSTKSQAFLYLELKGYQIKKNDISIEIFKYGLKQGDVSLTEIDSRIKNLDLNKQRILQLRSIIKKYANQYNSTPYYSKVDNPTKVYKSDLSDFLLDKLNIELVFHGKKDRAYGYTILDHSTKTILKGSQVLPLKFFYDKRDSPSNKSEFEKLPESKNVKALLTSAKTDFPTVREGLRYHNLILLEKGPHDISVRTNEGEVELKTIFNDSSIDSFKGHYRPDFTSQNIVGLLSEFSLSEDVDDEAINGRGRKKQRKTDRKNSR